jgi:hypothetical protein
LRDSKRMSKSSPKRRPGDVILGRYMPDASQEEREAARANLYGFVAVLLRIATREALDNVEKSIRANGEGEVESESLTNPI